MCLRRRDAFMNKPSAESGTVAFGLPLTRRRALTRAGAGLAGIGLGAASGRPSQLLAQEASPPADEPAPVDAPGIVTSQRAARAVERLPDLAETMLRQSGVPGMAVAVIHDDALAFVGGFGVRELGKEGAIDADTVFQLASVSKSLAATVVSSVVGDGTVAWESRMGDIAPGFALHDAWPRKMCHWPTCSRIAAGCSTTRVICWRTSVSIARRSSTGSATSSRHTAFEKDTN